MHINNSSCKGDVQKNKNKKEKKWNKKQKWCNGEVRAYEKFNLKKEMFIESFVLVDGHNFFFSSILNRYFNLCICMI